MKYILVVVHTQAVSANILLQYGVNFLFYSYKILKSIKLITYNIKNLSKPLFKHGQ